MTPTWSFQKGLEGCCKYPQGKLGNCYDLRHPKFRSRYRPNTCCFDVVIPKNLFFCHNFSGRTWDPVLVWVETSCCAHVLLEKAPKPGLKLPAGQARHTSKTSVVHMLQCLRQDATKQQKLPKVPFNSLSFGEIDSSTNPFWLIPWYLVNLGLETSLDWEMGCDDCVMGYVICF